MGEDVVTTTSIQEGKIRCALYGELTGTDCGELQQSEHCSGCFIFKAMKAVESEIRTEPLEKFYQILQ